MDRKPPPAVSATPPQRTPERHHLPIHNNCEYSEKDAYFPHHQNFQPDRYSKSSHHGCPRDSVISHPLSPKTPSPPSPGTSIASIGPRQSSPATQHPISPLDRQSLQYPPRAYVDPEKQEYRASQGRHSYRTASAAEAVVYDQGSFHEKGPEENAWQLLFFLSGPCALLSAAIALWTIAALLLSLVLAPLRLCSTRPTLSEQLKTFLAPALNLQLHLVYSHDSATHYSTPMLIVVHLFSPIVAFGVAIAAWTAAAFWFFSSILGDPGGHDGHNDGKESILGVRKWWERWLSRALRASSTRVGDFA